MAIVFLRTVIIYLILTSSMRLMGKRQIGELEVSELIVTFMLSELATIPISDSELPLLNAIVPIFLLLSLEVIISFCALKIPFLKRAIYGKPNILIEKGVLDQKELSRNRISLGELMCAARQNGIASLEDVYYAILEENGTISIIPNTSCAPVTPKIAKLTYTEEGISLPIIIDGKIIEENLPRRNLSEDSLSALLSSRRLTADEVFLLSVNDEGSIYIIRKDEN